MEEVKKVFAGKGLEPADIPKGESLDQYCGTGAALLFA